MSIASLEKITIVGHRDDKDNVLADLQQLGCLHLIPLTPEGFAAQDLGPSKSAREALRFIASATPRRRQITDSRRFDADAVEREALGLQKRLFELRTRRDFLATRVDNLAPWGEFEFPAREELGGERFWFFQVPHHLLPQVEATGLRWQAVDKDARFFYVVVVSPDEPHGMPVDRVHTGARSRHELVAELEDVEVELEDIEAERVSLSRWCNLFARALDGLEDSAARAQAAAQTAQAEPVYALQAWAPRARMEELRSYSKLNALALEEVEPAPDEVPPTLLANPTPLRAGEDLVAFYMTPSYWLWDPSSVVFFSFAVFFAMIVADAGYALLLAAIVLIFRKRLGGSESGRRWRVMLSVMAAATAIYGVMAGSYFGVTPAEGSFLDHFHLFDLDNFSVMMAVSILIGAVHVSYGCVMDAMRYPDWPRRLPSLGWAGAIMGGLAVWGSMQLDSAWLQVLGVLFAVAGLALVVGFSGYGEKPVKRALKGVSALTAVSGAFGDVMSYLRLFALGLASASLAMAFNGMASDVREALPGVGFLFALLILLLGHGLNFILAVASGFIHGLRLNVIEFFKWGVKEEGHAYRPFEQKESNSG